MVGLEMDQLSSTWSLGAGRASQTAGGFFPRDYPVPPPAPLQSRNSAQTAQHSPGGRAAAKTQAFPLGHSSQRCSKLSQQGRRFLLTNQGAVIHAAGKKFPRKAVGGVCLWEPAVCHFEPLLPEQWDFNRPPHSTPAGGTAAAHELSRQLRCEGPGNPQTPTNPPQSILPLLPTSSGG